MDILHKIPDNWVWTTLAQIADMTSGGTPSRTRKEYWNGNINWLKSGELKDTYIHEVEEKITEDGLKGSSAKIFPKDTLLMAMYGATVGRLGILNVDSSTNQAVCAIFNHHKLFINEYIFFYLLSMRQKMLKDSFGGAQPNLSQGYIKSIDIPFAPLKEQKRIVAKIEKLFSNLDNSDKYLLHLEKQLKRYRQSVLKSAFEGKLTKEWREKQTNLETADELLEKIKIERTIYIENDIREKFKDKTEKWIKDKVKNEVDKFYTGLKHIEDDEKPFFIPSEWKWIRFEELTLNLDGNRIPITKSSRVEGSIPYYGASGIIDYVKDYIFDGEHLLIAEDGANLLTRNKPIAFIANEKFWVNNHAHIVKSFSNIPHKFLSNFINFIDLKFYITGSAQPKLNQQALNKIIIPLCSLEEQIKVVEEIEKHFSIIDKLEAIVQQSIKESKRLRQSILKQAFEGKLVEQDPNDESASILLEKIAKAKEEYQKAMKRKR